ncbi:Acetolactate synthase large subunit [Planctomycetes bacterium Pan216]|uniref:Acetolactate synthase n=1 Tax=Kolteria novifilia TaxID=2527975 RepID=A0A518B9F6_9BACT|nr:Acetolactate synthase large subunit [Planctomycetes bacterium Pan216]
MSTCSEPVLGCDLLVDCMIREGVEVVFAYPGGASMPIHQALTRRSKDLRTILPRFEQGGGFAAEGYARATGKVGVCIATSGPGATNFTTCLADAKMDSTPIVAITGQVPTKVIGTDAFQETPIVEIARPITKHHFLVQHTEDIPRVVKEAFYIAQSGRPGPVLIDVPKDLQNRRIVPDYDPAMNLPGYNPDKHASSAELDRVIEMVKQAKRPVIYAGGGVVSSDASAALKKFAISLGIPVTTTLQGIGCFPGEHYLSLHMLGMHGTVYANYAVDAADLLLAWGVRFDDRVTGKIDEFCKHGKIVHIDIDSSELNKNKPACLAIQSDIRYAIDELNTRVEAEPFKLQLEDWHRQIDEWRTSEPLKYDLPEGAILPQHAIKEMWELLKERGELDRTVVATGVGQHQMWAAQYWKFNEPRLWLTSGGLGSMGYGLPAAMGAQSAHPDKIVIDIDGDGSFLMNIQELATIHTENLPVKVLLLNNQHLGMVVQWEDRFYESNRGHTYLGDGNDKPPYPDFVKMAESFGVQSKSIRDPRDLRSSLEEMIDYDGPYVLNVMVPHQEHVLPMIPSGQTVRDIIKT